MDASFNTLWECIFIRVKLARHRRVIGVPRMAAEPDAAGTGS